MNRTPGQLKVDNCINALVAELKIDAGIVRSMHRFATLCLTLGEEAMRAGNITRVLALPDYYIATYMDMAKALGVDEDAMGRACERCMQSATEYLIERNEEKLRAMQKQPQQAAPTAAKPAGTNALVEERAEVEEMRRAEAGEGEADALAALRKARDSAKSA